VAPFDPDAVADELPWLLMESGPVTKYWRRDGFEEDIAELQELGFRVARFDVSSWVDKDAMFTELCCSLRLDHVPGMGFDWLDDTLRSLDVPDEGGLVVALDNFTESAGTNTLLRVFADASRWWLLFGRVFAIALRTDDSDYEGPADLGVTRAHWNYREQLDARRQPLP